MLASMTTLKIAALPNQSFQVAATVVAGCLINGGPSIGKLDFGSQAGSDRQLFTASMVQNTAFSLACSPGTTLSMRIDGSSHYTSQRNLQRVGGTQLIGYRLYTDAGLTPANAIPVGQDVSLSYSDANHIVLPVYGALQLSGMSLSGTYTDTLTVTVTLTW
ncbi:Spore Coat Protein U domain protein [Sodalis glossinidius str. 'morsitans']|uniref:Spore Coat Protein U domain protein n=1 Tax=Sodalis glossinidius (strain morsitans) TaxID=343509 RepID=A0A193QKI9_SODGM|nr:spore coat protein U domain-containing protein [Sodalis glossinidius]CRL45613.1 Spore Coat Protein U domain protein [Sodalis glossinidius str. 'morsitans']